MITVAHSYNKFINHYDNSTQEKLSGGKLSQSPPGRVYIKRGIHPEPPGTTRNLTGTTRNLAGTTLNPTEPRVLPCIYRLGEKFRVAELPLGAPGACIYCNDNSIFWGEAGHSGGEASTPQIP